MIISHKYKFIFIKTRKTAGTSIEAYLSPLCGDEDVFTPINPHVEPHLERNYQGYYNPLPYLTKAKTLRRARGELRRLSRRIKYYNHMRAYHVRRLIGEQIWTDYRTFCVERNPWEKTLSLYSMVKNSELFDLTDLSFDDFLSKAIACRDYGLYSDETESEVIVDRILRYERLADDLGEMFGELGVPFEGDLGVRAKSGHRDASVSYRSAYTDGQAEIVRRAFDKEIALLGYAF